MALSIRDLVRPRNPLALVANENRIAPAHVLNGFVAASLGDSSPAFQNVHRAMYPDLVDDPCPAWFQPSGTTDPRNERRQFAKDLRVILDPDRRTFTAAPWSSVFPVVGQAANPSNPSDSNMGSCLWLIVQNRWPDEVHTIFREMLAGAGSDPISHLARIVGSVGPLAASASSVPQDPFPDAWFRQATGAGARLANALSRFLAGFVVRCDGAERLYRIQLFGYALHLSMCLAQIFGPRVAAGEDAELGDGLAVIVMGGQPPGDTKTPLGAGIARSFSKAVRQSERAYVRLLTDSLERAVVSSSTTDVDRCLHRMSQVTGQAVTESDLLSLAKEAGLGDPGELTAIVSPSEIAEVLVASGPLSRTLASSRIRTLCSKIGFAAPNRGFGAPRFVAETPLLATLVTGLCSGQGQVPFDQFLELAKANLGLVLGPARATPVDAAVDGVWESGSAERMLGENAEALRKRLVRSGLGREYSDGHTEVGPRV